MTRLRPPDENRQERQSQRRAFSTQAEGGLQLQGMNISRGTLAFDRYLSFSFSEVRIRLFSFKRGKGYSLRPLLRSNSGRGWGDFGSEYRLRPRFDSVWLGRLRCVPHGSTSSTGGNRMIPHLLFYLLLLTASLTDGNAPPQEMPVDQVRGFTLNGQISVERFYVDDSNKGRGMNYR